MTIDDLKTLLMIIGFFVIITIVIKLFVITKKHFKGESYKPLDFTKERIWSITKSIFTLSLWIFCLNKAIIYDKWYWWISIVILTVLKEIKLNPIKKN